MKGKDKEQARSREKVKGKEKGTNVKEKYREIEGDEQVHRA